MLKIKLSETATLELLAEECTELAHAALKLARIQRGENPTPVRSDIAASVILAEAADVTVCLDLIRELDWYDEQYVKQIIEYKKDRMQRRIHDSERGTETDLLSAAQN